MPIISLLSVVGGVVLACAADYAPSHRVALERAGGLLLVGGLGVLGWALHCHCG